MYRMILPATMFVATITGVSSASASCSWFRDIHGLLQRVCDNESGPSFSIKDEHGYTRTLGGSGGNIPRCNWFKDEHGYLKRVCN
jgi:hypothetical protein